jgi:hypothetical protein
MADRPRAFAEVVGAEDPAERERMERTLHRLKIFLPATRLLLLCGCTAEKARTHLHDALLVDRIEIVHARFPCWSMIFTCWTKDFAPLPITDRRPGEHLAGRGRQGGAARSARSPASRPYADRATRDLPMRPKRAHQPSCSPVHDPGRDRSVRYQSLRTLRQAAVASISL